MLWDFLFLGYKGGIKALLELEAHQKHQDSSSGDQKHPQQISWKSFVFWVYLGMDQSVAWLRCWRNCQRAPLQSVWFILSGQWKTTTDFMSIWPVVVEISCSGPTCWNKPTDRRCLSDKTSFILNSKRGTQAAALGLQLINTVHHHSIKVKPFLS